MTLIRHSTKVEIHACPHRRYRNQLHLAPENVSGITGMSAPDICRYTVFQGRVFTSTQSIKKTSPRWVGSHSSNLLLGLPPRHQDATVNELERLFKLPTLHSQDD